MSFPSNPTVGQQHVLGGRTYVWSGFVWNIFQNPVNVNSGITGPQGPAGATGPQGIPGPAGATGPAGLQGATGPIGQLGATGVQGATGPLGPGILIAGVVTEWPPTESPTVGDVWVFSSVIPSGSPAGASLGGGVVWTGADWSYIGNILGPPGATGATGGTGATGPQGLNGPAGPTGPQGVTGPQGATGSQGAAGVQGATGVTGQLGATGPTGPSGSGSSTVVTLTYAANITTNATSGDIFNLTLTGNAVLENPTNPIDGKTLRWRIKQDATGGRSVTLGNKFNIPASSITPLPFSAAANKVDVLAATYDASRDTWDVVAFLIGY